MDEIKRLQKLAGLLKEEHDFNEPINVSKNWDKSDPDILIEVVELVDMWDYQNQTSAEAVLIYEGILKNEFIQEMSEFYSPYTGGENVEAWLKNIMFDVYQISGYMEHKVEEIKSDGEFDVNNAEVENQVDLWIKEVKIVD